LTSRIPIPRGLEREILLEAGHRCAIPTCRQTPVEIAHITGYKEVNEHTFDNLIALCPTCHTRYDKKEIDRKSMLHYKANLSIINGRYSDFEQRIIMYFADHPDVDEIRLSLSGNTNIQIMNLVRDGHLTFDREMKQSFSVGIEPDKIFKLSKKGRKFIEKWVSASELD
jgi:hypothetical protein